MRSERTTGALGQLNIFSIDGSGADFPIFEDQQLITPQFFPNSWTRERSGLPEDKDIHPFTCRKHDHRTARRQRKSASLPQRWFGTERTDGSGLQLQVGGLEICLEDEKRMRGEALKGASAVRWISCTKPPHQSNSWRRSRTGGVAPRTGHPPWPVPGPRPGCSGTLLRAWADVPNQSLGMIWETL